MRTVPDPSSVGGRGMDFITTVASVGLALVLLCSIGFALYASATTSSADQRLTVALRLSILYTNARFQAGAEESQERQYLLDPGPTAAAAHASAARALATILRAVVARAPTANAAEAVGLLELHRRYLGGTHRMFAAIDAHDPVLARTIDHHVIDPVFALIQSRINRRAAEQLGFARAARAVRHRLPLTLAVLDIDDFRQVNDQHGHRHGDQVLVELAGILSAGRASDRTYRLGGDEFALILPHTAAADAQAVLERIRLAAAEALHGSTVSIGYSTVERFDTTAETLQHQADAALYSTKRGGRNGVSRFDPSHQGSRLISPERVKSLRALLASGTMPIAFQPIWDL